MWDIKAPAQAKSHKGSASEIEGVGGAFFEGGGFGHDCNYIMRLL